MTVPSSVWGESDPYLRICIKGLLIFHGPDVGPQVAAAAPSEQYSIFLVDLYAGYLLSVEVAVCGLVCRDNCVGLVT